jgi:hypothetical protein
MSLGTLNRNICKDSWEIYFEINWKSYFYAFLSPIWVKVFKRFSFWVIFYNWNNYSGKTKCANDLKFCTKISGLNLHQMVHLSEKSIFSPIMSKNLSGVPLIGRYRAFHHHPWTDSIKTDSAIYLCINFIALGKSSFIQYFTGSSKLHTWLTDLTKKYFMYIEI